MSEDFYHDDPAEPSHPKKSSSKLFGSAVLILASVLFFQTTIAGNISTNSGKGFEFGQGVSNAVACSGNSNITLTPSSVFVNATDVGSHYLSSISVKDIPDNCNQVVFTINAYGNSGTSPIALFGSSGSTINVYANSGIFEIGNNGTGVNI